MPRGDNLTKEARAKGGRNSHKGSKGGRSGGKSKRGLASADQETRERVAREGGES
ncbi:MAG: hypothetical protein ACM3IJ_00275 [Candidatus Levyibacteriota bacterium]